MDFFAFRHLRDGVRRDDVNDGALPERVELPVEDAGERDDQSNEDEAFGRLHGPVGYAREAGGATSIHADFTAFGGDGVAVELDALRAGAVGFDPIGVILFDAGNDEAGAEALVVEGGVAEELAGGDDLATDRALVLAVFKLPAGGALEEIAEMLIPDAHVWVGCARVGPGFVGCAIAKRRGSVR